ncbi:MAG: hypothetical protein M1831_004778 [Alyxoria varia]|nr:MAG: hypothetical protein M1831_004778 [Alyxoria varia]
MSRLFSNPFEATSSRPGEGKIHLDLLPPSTPVLKQLSYQYPLKLVSPSVTTTTFSDASATPGQEEFTHRYKVHTIYLLNYGGGIVAGDSINLHVHLAATTRLILLTQGSTKIFKTPDRSRLSRQYLSVDILRDAALCYLPDPVQPFEHSSFEQKQVYHMRDPQINLCVCDWVCEGRAARGEKWSFHQYTSRNEVWLKREDSREPRLVLRDNVILDGNQVGEESIPDRMYGLGAFGTLILHGPMFRRLEEFFLKEFELLPRIGAKQWDVPSDSAVIDPSASRRALRWEHEKRYKLLGREAMAAYHAHRGGNN